MGVERLGRTLSMRWGCLYRHQNKSGFGQWICPTDSQHDCVDSHVVGWLETVAAEGVYVDGTVDLAIHPRIVGLVVHVAVVGVYDGSCVGRVVYLDSRTVGCLGAMESVLFPVDSCVGPVAALDSHTVGC